MMKYFSELFPVEVRKTFIVVVLAAFIVGVFIGVGLSMHFD